MKTILYNKNNKFFRTYSSSQLDRQFSDFLIVVVTNAEKKKVRVIEQKDKNSFTLFEIHKTSLTRNVI